MPIPRRSAGPHASGARRSAGPDPSGGLTPRPRPRYLLLLAVATALCAVLTACLVLRDAPGPWEAGSDPDQASGSRPSAVGGECAPTALLEPPCGAWFGAFVPHDKSNLSEKVRDYEERIGRTLDVVYTYHDMSLVEGDRLEGQLLTAEEQRVAADDHLLLLSWESKWWGGTDAQQPTWKQIADGDLDASVIDVQARRVKEFGEKVFLSFDLEMDTRTPANGTPEDYVRAYRHIHDRFRDLGVTNVVWTWITTGYLEHADVIERMYPGDDYVDWVAYNQYNYFRCHQADWLTFAQTQQATHDWIRENISDDKPLMLSEFGTANDPSRPGRQAEWYAQVPSVLKGLTGVKAALQWNYRDPGPHCDLALADDQAWNSLRKAVSDPYLNQPLG
ncbi:glycoside hydrolase family 26 protein [Streptomyces sp. NPDC059894]|uniref:glycoside hydrolase family 26 protein n=1 Tax=unclassified Streptomyces TaxID=2593676 RepID=UPI003651BAF3